MSLSLEGMCPLLQVFDMPTSVAFYRDLLGFEVIESAPSDEPWDWVWLRSNDAEVMLNTAYEAAHRPPAPDPARIAAHADTAIYFGCRDVEGAYESLSGRGIELGRPLTAPYGMRQLYVLDPDGYNLCFQWPAEPDGE